MDKPTFIQPVPCQPNSRKEGAYSYVLFGVCPGLDSPLAFIKQIFGIYRTFTISKILFQILGGREIIEIQKKKKRYIKELSLQ